MFCSGELLQRDTTKGTPRGDNRKGHHKRDTTGGTTQKGHHKRDTTRDNTKGTPWGTTQKGHHKRDTMGGQQKRDTIGGTTEKGHHKRDTTGGTTGDNGGGQQGAPCIPINQFSQLLKMMKIHIFVILNLYTKFQYENIMTTKICL